MRKARLDELQARIETAKRNIANSLRYAEDTTLIVENKESLKNLLSEGEEGEWNEILKKLRSWHPAPSLRGNLLLFFSHSVMSNSLRPPWTEAPQTSVLHCLPEIVQIHAIESVMPSNHLVLCCPLLLLPSIFPSIQWVGSLHQVQELALSHQVKYWSFSFNISPSNEHLGLISFRMDWFDLLAVQGTLKSLLQHHSSKGSILWCSAFFMNQLSHPYMTTGKTIVLTIGTLYFMANRKRKGGSSDRFPLLGLWNHRRWWQQPRYEKMIACRQESYEKPRQYVKERHHFADQGPYSQDYGLSISQVWLWKVDHKEGTGAFLNCGAGEDSWESLGQQADQTRQS